MTDRRTFFTRGGAALGALALAPTTAIAETMGRVLTPPESVDAMVQRAVGRTPEALQEDEEFWADLRNSYSLREDVINLDHGWTNPTPSAALDELTSGLRRLEGLPAEELPRMWFEITNTTVRAAMADVLGVPGSEIAFVRNATEALDTVLLGVPMSAGDEVVCSAHDYYAMLDALEQRRARDGIVLRIVRPPVPAPSMDALASLYESEMGPRTRLVLLTHPSNLTGQLLPVARIAAAAHRVGAEVVVDGAQSLGLFDNPITTLDCDYYGASAHKWLGTPVGLGVLWMKPEQSAKVWPLIPPAPGVSGMERFEWIGTAPAYIEPAALPAIALHRSLGAARKLARLRYLGDLLRQRLTDAMSSAVFYTKDVMMSAGLNTFALPGMDPTAVQKELRERHGILVQAMTNNQRAPEIQGLRVSPNVYTSPAELDRFVSALSRVVGR